METKTKNAIGIVIGAVSLPLLLRILGVKTTKTLLISAPFGALLGWQGAYIVDKIKKSNEDKSNVVSGGKTVFDEVCYKNCTNGCKLDDSGCFTKCRTDCTSKGGGKATSMV